MSTDEKPSVKPAVSAQSHGMPGLPTIDVREKGGKIDGEQQAMDKRLFMQLLVLRAGVGEKPHWLVHELVSHLTSAKIGSVVYENVNDPRGVGLLTWSEDPAHFVKKVRPLFDHSRIDRLELVPAYTMLGRTYSLGHEPKLEDSLLARPRRVVNDPSSPWAVWYPLRRTGAFSALDPHEQSMILREHAAIGMAYGQQELAHDVRLACHGIDENDNEFVVGLIGKELHPLSHCVQMMRKTRQTREFIDHMGPFFVGHVCARTAES